MNRRAVPLWCWAEGGAYVDVFKRQKWNPRVLGNPTEEPFLYPEWAIAAMVCPLLHSDGATFNQIHQIITPAGHKDDLCHK